ncbi:MAG TPA: hypothetical protein VIV40_22155 [Kofleriaceae bacterium]
MKVIVLAAVLAVACTPYVSAGYDTNSSLRGPVKNMVTMPAATARQETAPPVQDTRSYSFAVGAGFGERMGVELGVHLHDVNGASFSMPSIETMGVDPNSPRYLLGSTSCDVRYRPIALRHLTSDVHIGPAWGLLVDRGMADYQFGQGVRFGATLGLRFGKVSAFADIYETEMVFADGDAKGVSGLTGVTFGILVR